MTRAHIARIVFALGLLLAAAPFTSPGLALLAGIALGLSLPHPFPQATHRWTTRLLQASVVGLGFGMNLSRVLKAGRAGFLYTALSIVLVIALGLLLGHLLKIARNVRLLISAGTAICGGSAIAALGPLLGADSEEMTVSLGAVFLLNSVALFVFPKIGAAAGLTQTQFGLWSALAIHDTSSVIGATLQYGAAALAVGATVKLARALWIVPVSFGAAAWRKSNAKVRIPWFILLFCAAAAINTVLPPSAAPALGLLKTVAISALSVTLFLIGSTVSRTALRRVGPRPLLHALLLWLAVATVSFTLIRSGRLPL